MKTAFKKGFLKQIEKITDEKLRNNIYEVLVEVENSKTISEMHNVKKLKGFSKHYRVRLGDFRIGLYLEDETVYFTAFGHRKDIYKRFP